jgi:hypothetical protein
MSETVEVPDLYRLAFIPGAFRCPQCDFQLTKTCINANTGEMGTREQERESEPCPNDGTYMVHVTYREQLEEYAARLKEEFDRIDRLKAALLRNRQGYVNILEMRKLSSEQWGQRDGYGGRYGALTREEIETVIAQIDEALA